MATLSIILPDSLARASKDVAAKLGVSRTEFIRQAIANELENYAMQLEQRGIVEAIEAMKKNPAYLKDSEEITNTLLTSLPDEEENWWTKRS